jgi:VWFA-related protein
LGAAIRTIEPRLEKILEPPDGPSPTKPLAEEDDVVQLESPLVNLNASVTDAEGKVIGGLRVEDFTVTEDGVKQPITHFATETTPFNLVLLLDVSGSTRGKIGLIKQAARRFLDLMRPSDKIAILLFARDVEVIAHLTSDRDALRQALAQITPPLGSTAVYDAIAYALVEELDRVRGERNAVVVVTDGRDSSLAYAETPLQNDPLRRPGSFLRFSDLLLGVRHSDVVVYPIAIDNEAELAATLNESGREQVRADSRRVREQFQQLADISGGRVYRAAQLDSLDGVYEQIAADLRTIYSVAYAPTRMERDGRWRRVEVRVARPGARVRCPRGYFAR